MNMQMSDLPNLNPRPSQVPPNSGNQQPSPNPIASTPTASFLSPTTEETGKRDVLSSVKNILPKNKQMRLLFLLLIGFVGFKVLKKKKVTTAEVGS